MILCSRVSIRIAVVSKDYSPMLKFVNFRININYGNGVLRLRLHRPEKL